MNLELTIDNKKTLLKLARITIADALEEKENYTKNDLDFSDSVFGEQYGAFVTIHQKGSLRGCIGYIQGIMPLKKAIEQMANSAAFRDPRFPAISNSEYKDIDLEISVLSPIEPVGNIDEIEVGRDGLIMSTGFNSGLLLPQVATENNWNKETFLAHTCMKAGLPPESWKNNNIKIEKFSAIVFSEKELF